MQAQAYEGYFENGRFYPVGQIAHIKGRRRAYITILGEPARNDNIKKSMAEFDKLVDDSADEILRAEDFPRFNFGRELFAFSDGEA